MDLRVGGKYVSRIKSDRRKKQLRKERNPGGQIAVRQKKLSMALDNPIFCISAFSSFPPSSKCWTKNACFVGCSARAKGHPSTILGDITAFVPPTHRTFGLGGHSYTIIAGGVLSFVALLMLPRPQEMILYGGRCLTHTTTFGIIVRPGDMATITLSQQDGN